MRKVGRKGFVNCSRPKSRLVSLAYITRKGGNFGCVKPLGRLAAEAPLGDFTFMQDLQDAIEPRASSISKRTNQ